MSQDYMERFYYSYEHFINAEVEEGVFDEVITYHASRVLEEHRETYLNTFSRNALIWAFEEGKKEVYLEYQQADDSGVFHWLATHTMFFDNPYSDDIMEITISQNIDERVKKEKEQQWLIKDALQLAEKANDAKTDFLSRMSHDIRTPMNAIIGMTTIGKANSGNKDKVEECFGKIEISSKFLLSLINDILDLSKIESGKMSVNLELFSIRDMLESLTNSVTTLTNDKGQTFRYSVDDNISEFYKGDALRIEQILLNLLSNACKFTQENGDISLCIELNSHDKDRDILQMTVEDNEFNQEVAKTIFEMHNLDVDIASDGFEAVEKFLNSEPGYYITIFMDIQMPGMNGYETTKQIRRSDHPDGKIIPIYAMTANAFDTDISMSKQYGMNGHISKPVDFGVAAQILANHMKDDVRK